MPQYYSIGWDVIMSLHGWFSLLILSSSFLFFSFYFFLFLVVRNDMNKNEKEKNACCQIKDPVTHRSFENFEPLWYCMLHNEYLICFSHRNLHIFPRIHLQLLRFAIIQCVSCAKLLMNIFFALVRFVSSCENIDFVKMQDFFVYMRFFEREFRI